MLRIARRFNHTVGVELRSSYCHHYQTALPVLAATNTTNTRRSFTHTTTQTNLLAPHNMSTPLSSLPSAPVTGVVAASAVDAPVPTVAASAGVSSVLSALSLTLTRFDGTTSGCRSILNIGSNAFRTILSHVPYSSISHEMSHLLPILQVGYEHMSSKGFKKEAAQFLPFLNMTRSLTTLDTKIVEDAERLFKWRNELQQTDSKDRSTERLIEQIGETILFMFPLPPPSPSWTNTMFILNRYKLSADLKLTIDTVLTFRLTPSQEVLWCTIIERLTHHPIMKGGDLTNIFPIWRSKVDTHTMPTNVTVPSASMSTPSSSSSSSSTPLSTISNGLIHPQHSSTIPTATRKLKRDLPSSTTMLMTNSNPSLLDASTTRFFSTIGSTSSSSAADATSSDTNATQLLDAALADEADEHELSMRSKKNTKKEKKKEKKVAIDHAKSNKANNQKRSNRQLDDHDEDEDDEDDEFDERFASLDVDEDEDGSDEIDSSARTHEANDDNHAADAADAVDHTSLNPTKLHALNTELSGYYLDRCLTSQETLDRTHLLQRLTSLVQRKIDPSFTCIVFGSSASGTAMKGSDMDVAIVTRTGAAIEGGRPKAIMIKLLKGLRTQPNQFIQLQPVLHARVPIVKFVDKFTGISVDVAMGQTATSHKSSLMSGYANLDPRVSQLMVLVKVWAKAHDLNDASRNTLNSFGYALLVIQYLQCVQPAILPSLQQQLESVKQEEIRAIGSSGSSSSNDVSTIGWKLGSSNELKLLQPRLEEFVQRNSKEQYYVRTSSSAPSSSSSSSPSPSPSTPSSPNLAELLLGFFHFYGYVFDASKMGICIRSGGVILKSSLVGYIRSSNTKARTELVIGDPFDVTDNVARGITSEIWLQIRRCLRTSYSGLIATGKFEKILIPDTRTEKRMRKLERMKREREVRQQQQQQQHFQQISQFQQQPSHHQQQQQHMNHKSRRQLERAAIRAARDEIGIEYEKQIQQIQQQHQPQPPSHPTRPPKPFRSFQQQQQQHPGQPMTRRGSNSGNRQE